MKINYFQPGGSTPYRTAHPESAYNVSPETEALYNAIGALSQRTMMDQAVALRNKAMQQPKPIEFNSVNDDIINQVIRGKFGNGQARIDALTAAGYNPKEVQAAVNAKLKGVTPKPIQSPVTESTPLQTQPTVTKGTVPVYNVNGNPTGEQKTVYFGRGQQPRQQATVAPASASVPAQPQTTTPATKQTATQQQPAWKPGMAYPSVSYLSNYEGPTLWDDIKNATSGVVEASKNMKNAQKQSGYSAGNYASNNNHSLEGVVDMYHLPEWKASTTYSEIADRYRRAYGYKQGGSINYFQQGGQMQQDPVGQVIQGLLQDPQGTMQALSQMQGQQGGKEQVNAILQEIVKRAKGGDQQAAQAVQVLQQAMQGGQQQTQQAPAAKNGAKLNYLKQLKGKCPEGEELVYMKKGGTVCPVCQKKKDGGEAKVNKKQFFGKDKKVTKEQEGGDITATQRKSKAGNEIGIEKHNNGLTKSFMQGPALSRPYFMQISKGDTTVTTTGPQLGAQYQTTPTQKQEAINFFNAQDTLPLLYKKKVSGDAAMYKEGGKTQFFKKEKKASLAKCGSKMKADKCGGKMKAKKK